MKGNEQPIDHIFRDKLEGYTVSPSPGMLENIRTGLRNRKRKQRIVLMRAIAAAAVIVLALVAGWMLYDAPESNLRLKCFLRSGNLKAGKKSKKQKQSDPKPVFQ